MTTSCFTAGTARKACKACTGHLSLGNCEASLSACRQTWPLSCEPHRLQVSHHACACSGCGSQRRPGCTLVEAVWMPPGDCPSDGLCVVAGHLLAHQLACRCKQLQSVAIHHAGRSSSSGPPPPPLPPAPLPALPLLHHTKPRICCSERASRHCSAHPQTPSLQGAQCRRAGCLQEVPLSSAGFCVQRNDVWLCPGGLQGDRLRGKRERAHQSPRPRFFSFVHGYLHAHRPGQGAE